MPRVSQDESMPASEDAALVRLRAYLRAAGGAGAAPSAVPTLLSRAARRAVRRSAAARDSDAADDVCAAVLEQIARRRDGGQLAALPSRKLQAALARRCRQAAAEQSPRWDLRKQLREHVAVALGSKTALAEAALPEGLVVDGRFSSECVAGAISSLLAQPLCPRRHATELTSALMKQYFPAPEPLGRGLENSADQAATSEDDLIAELDAPRHAARLRAVLGEALSCVLSLRLLGKKLQEIAEVVRIGVATAHAWLREAEVRVRAYAENAQATAVSLHAALWRLAAADEVVFVRPEPLRRCQ